MQNRGLYFNITTFELFFKHQWDGYNIGVHNFNCRFLLNHHSSYEN